MYTDVSSFQKMFASNTLGFRNPHPQYPGQYPQYFGQGHGSDGKMPCALTFTGKNVILFSYQMIQVPTKRTRNIFL